MPVGSAMLLDILGNSCIEVVEVEEEKDEDVFEHGYATLRIDADVYEALSMETCVAQRRSYGGPSPDETSRQIAMLKQFIESHTEE